MHGKPMPVNRPDTVIFRQLVQSFSVQKKKEHSGSETRRIPLRLRPGQSPNRHAKQSQQPRQTLPPATPAIYFPGDGRGVSSCRALFPPYATSPPPSPLLLAQASLLASDLARPDPSGRSGGIASRRPLRNPGFDLPVALRMICCLVGDEAEWIGIGPRDSFASNYGGSRRFLSQS